MTDRELMQMALDALELNNTMHNMFVARLLRERLSQPEPEPVAWREIMGKWKTHYYDYNEDGRGEPLYTAPPKRDCLSQPDHLRDATKKVWVGLTNDEISSFPISEGLIYAIEAKLREKNHG